MGIRGTVRRSTDGDFIHANIDIGSKLTYLTYVLKEQNKKLISSDKIIN